MKLTQFAEALLPFSADELLQATSGWDLNAPPTEEALSHMRTVLSRGEASYSADLAVSLARVMKLHPLRWPSEAKLASLRSVLEHIKLEPHHYTHLRDVMSVCVDTGNKFAIASLLAFCHLKPDSETTFANCNQLLEYI